MQGDPYTTVQSPSPESAANLVYYNGKWLFGGCERATRRDIAESILEYRRTGNKGHLRWAAGLIRTQDHDDFFHFVWDRSEPSA